MDEMETLAPPMHKLRLLCAPAAFMLLCGCAHVAPRPAVSSLGCMRAVRASLPANLGDKHAHCLASGLIARRCSVAEGYLAGAGKELEGKTELDVLIAYLQGMGVEMKGAK